MCGPKKSAETPSTAAPARALERAFAISNSTTQRLRLHLDPTSNKQIRPPSAGADSNINLGLCILREAILFRAHGEAGSISCPHGAAPNEIQNELRLRVIGMQGTFTMGCNAGCRCGPTALEWAATCKVLMLGVICSCAAALEHSQRPSCCF